MSDPDDFGDVSYLRLKKWQHSPRVLIRQSIRYSLRYFGASVIQRDPRDQNVISEATENLCAARGMKAGSKLNIKKLPKLDLEINYSKFVIHTQPSTTLDLGQILFCEKARISNDNKAFQYLAFVANVESQNTAYIFTCSNELAVEIYRTYTQLFDMHTLHTNCGEIKNAIRRVGCGEETSKHVQELWRQRDDLFRDSIYRIQSEVSRQLPVLEESLEKLARTDTEKDTIKEHTRLINELKHSLIQSVRHAQAVCVDSSVLMSQQLDKYLHPPRPAIGPSLSPNTSKVENSSEFNTAPRTTELNNVYETPKQLSPLDCPQLPNTPIPKFPVAFRTLSPSRKKSPAKTLFNTLKPLTRTGAGDDDLSGLKKLSLTNNDVETSDRPSSTLKTDPLSPNDNEDRSHLPTDSNYYETSATKQTPPSESSYYEGPINVASIQEQQPEDPYYYCPMPANQTSNQPNETETRPGAETTAESVYVANESQSESSASRANSIRESHVFEDEDPESVYIMH